MANQRLGIIMHGVTGRMGMNQQLARSIVAIRKAQIERAGKDRLLAFHVCDWLTPTTDLLNDRGMMGDGVIDVPHVRGWVEAQGFAGYSEVEIFSAANWWQRDHGEGLDTCIQRHRSAV